MSMPEQSGDSFDFCVLFRVYFTGKGAAIHRKRAYLALGVQLSLLASLSLQVSVVKLQRLNNKVRLLSSGYGFRNELGYPFITESGLFLLVWLFFLHN